MPTGVAGRRMNVGRIHAQEVSGGSGLSRTRPIIAVVFCVADVATRKMYVPATDKS